MSVLNATSDSWIVTNTILGILTCMKQTGPYCVLKIMVVLNDVFI